MTARYTICAALCFAALVMHTLPNSAQQPSSVAEDVAGRKVDSELIPKAAQSRSREEAQKPEKQYDVRIVGGERAKLLDWPYAVALLRPVEGGWRHFCGGSLLSADGWILTAAHCPVEEGRTIAVVGRRDLREPSGKVLQVLNFVRHERYDKRTSANDIAVVRTNPAVGLPVATLGAASDRGTDAWGIGWGTISEGGPLSMELLEVSVPVITNQDCSRAYAGRETIVDGMLCAGAENKDTCQGDSGGPLLLGKGPTAIQIGVVSFGEGCGRKGIPGVYTRVSAYRGWVSKATGLQLQ